MKIQTVLQEYKNKLKDEQNQPFLNEKIDNLLNLLNSSETFNEINENDVKLLLTLIDYDDSEIEKVLMTLKYAKLNNSYSEYKDLFEEIFNKFLILKKPFRDLSIINKLLENTNVLLEILESDNLLVRQENLNFFLKIVDEEKLDMEVIITGIKEIDDHNHKVFAYRRKLQEEDSEVDLKTELESETIDLNDFIKDNSSLFAPDEMKILRELYINDKDIINKNLTYLLNTREFSFIKENLIEYISLFITLIGYSNVNIMNSIVSLCNSNNIDIKKLLPTYFVSKNHINMFKDSSYEFYSTLDGSYESFMELINLFKGSINLNKLIDNFPSLLMGDYNIVRKNIEVLKLYNIPLSDSSIKVLSDTNLLFKIDKFIELGLYEYITNVPTILLTKDEAIFYRIKYALENNIQIKRRFLLKEITDLNGLDINSLNYKSKIEVYKPTSISLPFYNHIIENQELLLISNDPIFNILKEYEVNNATYEIKNINISKNKVMRLFEIYKQKMKNKSGFTSNNVALIEVRGIIFAVLSDVILDKEETNMIINELLSKFKNYLSDSQMNMIKEEFNIEESIER